MTSLPLASRPHAPAHAASPHMVRELLPSASRHVALALVQVPGPSHTIEAQPYYRISFNIGPSYSARASGEHFEAAMTFARHALMVIPPGLSFTHHGNTPPPTGKRVRPGHLATFRISRELFSDSAISLGLGQLQAQLMHQIVPADETLRLLAQSLLADLRAGSPAGALATEAIAHALLCRLLLRQHKHLTAAATPPLDRVQAHIEAHLQGALTLQQLADVAGMSLFHFCRVFRDSLGVTPHQHILARRMAHARRLLWAQSGMSMLEIALTCGFGSSSHFAAQFKRHTGQTPLQWQRSR
ncbi:MAG: AraC family transcriptional regulator [Haliea sp.]|nr:MAG: AraC family transcriptional regulator [Haliea sp.]